MADKNEFDFTIGADPEFCCVDGRTLIESGAYTNNHDQFGCDGNGITFERKYRECFQRLPTDNSMVQV